MRHLRITFGIIVTACALAVAAVPAMAQQFVASKTGKTTGRGFEQIKLPPPGELPEFVPARMQEFKIGAFKILCYTATSKGEVTEEHSETFTTTTRFGRCGWYPQTNSLHTSATFSKGGLTATWHAKGFVEAEGNESGEEVEWKNIELGEVATAIKVGQKICQVTIPKQTIKVMKAGPAAIYSTITGPATTKFPTGQKHLLIRNAWDSIKFVYGGELNQCTAQEFEKLQEGAGGGGTGQYNGNLEETLTGGNLSFE
jgi:hypothetical protein